MLLSFRLQSDLNQHLEVKEFHINLWFFKSESLFVDIGIWIEIDLTTFLNNEIKLDLITPFLVNEKIEDLHSKMCNDSILRLLHNEEFSTTIGGTAHERIHHLAFRDHERGSFLILKSELEKKEDSLIKVKLVKDGIDQGKLRDIGCIKNDTKKIGVYLRFRYEVKVSNDSNLNLSSVVLHEKMLVDLRINDIRSDVSLNPTANIVKINKMMFFVILPISYEITEGTQFRKYVRILESKWKDYIDFEISEKFLVHYWRKDGIENDSYNLLLSARKEIEELTFGKHQNLLTFLTTRVDKIIQFFYLHILITLFVFLILIIDKLPNVLIYLAIPDYLINWVIFFVKIIAGGVSLIFTLIGGNALWDAIKYLWKKWKG